MAVDLTRLEIRAKDISPAKCFGKRIKQLRNARRIPQRLLAELVTARLRKEGHKSPHFTYLSKMEHEDRETGIPSELVILKLAEVLDADELLALAGRSPHDLDKKLIQKPAARAFFNYAIDRPTERDWQDLLEKTQILKRRMS